MPELVNEGVTRLIAFSAVLLALVLWERRAALRRQAVRRAPRWRTNLGMGAVGILILRAAYPAGAVGAALMAESHVWGVFNRWSLPDIVELAAALFLLDLVIYLQHRAFHAAPWLWRIHRVHHADPEVDVTTALRFHPLESALSMLLKVAVVLSFGLPAFAVLLFEIFLNAAAMFNHANVTLPPGLERGARYVVVTPDMHRIHHSTYRPETDSNFGFGLSWWDRLFRTYRASPRVSQLGMPLGLPDAPASAAHYRLGPALLMPFRSSRKAT